MDPRLEAPILNRALHRLILRAGAGKDEMCLLMLHGHPPEGLEQVRDSVPALHGSDEADDCGVGGQAEGCGQTTGKPRRVDPVRDDLDPRLRSSLPDVGREGPGHDDDRVGGLEGTPLTSEAALHVDQPAVA